MKPEIIFIGTPKFAAYILEGLIKSNYRPVLAVTGPDKPVGRKHIITPPDAKIAAIKHNIPVIQDINKIKASDLIISAGFGCILPKKILDMPRYGSLNVHPSLLPRHRGPSPIQTAILSQDKKTGTTIYLMDEKIDHGPIIAQKEYNIGNSDYLELEKALAELGADLLTKIIPKWISSEIKAKPQDESKATCTKIITREDGEIDWNSTAAQIESQIRAFRPWPGTFTFLKKNNKIIRVKILEAEVSKKEKKFSIKCKEDYLLIKRLQPEGKKPMTAEEFKKGYNGLF